MRQSRVLALFLMGYAILLLATIVATPLRLDEILQLIGSSNHSILGLIRWIAETPGSAPLNYFVQLPFVLAGSHSRIAARVPSLLFALGSSYLFIRLAKRIPVRWPYLALALFMLLPVHYRFASQGTPVEQALFFLLAATICYLRLVQNPSPRACVDYAAFLLLCLYTDPASFLPAIGYALFLIRSVNTAHGRRVIWFALPATTLPVLLFLPYYFWAHPQMNSDWLFEPSTYSSGLPIYLQPLHSLGAGGWNGYIIAGLLGLGTLAALWGLLRSPVRGLARELALFYLFGGVLSAVAIPTAIDLWSRTPFSPSHVLWAVPGMIILSFAAPESFLRKGLLDPVIVAFALLGVVLSCTIDIGYLRQSDQDLQAETALIRPQLTGDSCVVFVSERLSKSLFLLFDPALDTHECLNFFHKRVVLASHPYVRPDEQANAESYFRGLNFREESRMSAGGGKIIVLEQNQ